MLTSKKIDQKAIYWAGGAFIALNAVLLYFEQFWIGVVPIALAIVGLALFRLDWLFLLITFLTPFSIPVEDIGGGLGLHLPTEPLMFGMMLVFLLRLFYDGHFDKRVLRHPISIAIAVNMVWLIITAITSEEPLVSFKFLLSRAWFIIGFYFIATQVFRDPANIRRYLWLYIVPMVGVVIYTVIMHATHGFTEKTAHWVMQPFFKDHTSYGAVMAMFFPVMIGFMWSSRLSLNSKIVIGFLIAFMLVGIVLSYTRAAWVSLVGVLFVYIIMMLRIKFWVVLSGVLIVVGAFFAFQTEIMHKLEKNRQDSSDDLAEHVSSISNVATDASNLERLNRWNAALRMFQERPVVGWGPGTYKFHYAPFQHSQDLTIISTNFGDLGNAHSEYFGPLAESGIPGVLTFLVIIIIYLYRCIILYYELKSREIKIILMSTLLGSITYFVHGILNNFLDLDKAAVPFWGFMAILVAIELYHAQGSEKAAGY